MTRGPFLLEYRDIYADGRLLASACADAITVANPATEEIVGTAPAAVEKDVEIAVRAARHAFDTGTWSGADPADRANSLERLAAALDDRAEDIARLVTAEMGMPITFSRFHNGEIPGLILRYYAGLARRLEPEEIRAAITFAGRTVVRHEPIGVAAVIAAWNYPMALAFAQLAPALAAGCTTVLQPASETSLSAYILAEACEATDLPPGVFNLVTGTDEVTEMLARHASVDKLAFVGATSAGRRIAALCGEMLKPANLELGGKSAAIVLEDADLSATAAALGVLCFGNSGQACFAMSRVLAPRSRYQEVVDGLIAQASAMVIGDPMAPETTMGPLVSPRHRASVESYVASGIADGARVAAGGRRPAAPVRGYYYEPTVFAEATSTMTIARDEIFGPVVTVIPYRDEPEAVAVANDSEYGLAGSVWTSDPDHGLEIARKLHVGTFGVNLYIPDLGSPWGGFKSSGQGTAYGPEGLSAYLKPKSVFFPAPR